MTSTPVQLNAARLARNPGLVSAIVFAGLTLLMFGDLLFNPKADFLSTGQTDLMLQFIPWRQFGFDQMRQGNLPLWNPYSFSGTPCLGNFQSALLYPINWLYMVLPIRLAVNWGIAIHVFMAGWFTSLWCLNNRASLAGAILAGVMFAMGMPYFIHIAAGHLPFLCVAAWAPLLLLTLDKMRAGDRVLRWTLLGSLVVAMQILGGYPQPLFYTAITAGFYQLWLAHRSPAKVKLACGFVGMYALGAAISAMQLLPVFGVTAESVRAGGTTYAFATTFSLPPENFLTLLSPHVLGGLSLESHYFGRWYLWEVSMFVGLIALVLAVVGAVYAKGSVAIVSRVLAALLTILAMGSYTPVFRVFYDFFPGFSNFRVPARFFFLATLFLAMLAGMGWDRIVGNAVNLTRCAIACVVAGVLVGVMTLALSVTADNPDTPWAQAVQAVRESAGQYHTRLQHEDPLMVPKSLRLMASALVIPTIVLLATAAMLLVGKSRRRVLQALPVLACVEIFCFAYSDRETFASMPQMPPAWQGELTRLGDARVLMPESSFVNLGVPMHVRNIWGYDPVVLRRYAQFMAFSQKMDPDIAMESVPFGYLSPLLSIVRCKAVLLAQPEPRAMPIPNPLPRMLIVHDWQRAAGRDEIFARLTSPDFDPRRTVILESVPNPPPSSATVGESLQLLRETTDELEISAELSQSGLLLITDSYSTGWRARPLAPGPQPRYDVLPANFAVMAVPLSAGKHHLLLEYLPPQFVAGKWITLLSLGLLAILFAVDFRSRRRD